VDTRGLAVLRNGSVELGVKDHAGCGQNQTFREAERTRLLHGALRWAYHVLALPFHPEVGFVIGEIGQNGDEVRLGPHSREGLKHGAVVVRNEGDTMSVGSAFQCSCRTRTWAACESRISVCATGPAAA
jgi:hypothetical protein